MNTADETFTLTSALTLRQAYDLTLQAAEGTLTHREFWSLVGQRCGRPAGGARFSARRAGWPTKATDLPCVHPYAYQGRKKGTGAASTLHKTTIRMLLRAAKRLGKQTDALSVQMLTDLKKIIETLKLATENRKIK